MNLVKYYYDEPDVFPSVGSFFCAAPRCPSSGQRRSLISFMSLVWLFSYSKRGSTSMINFYYNFSVIAVIVSCYTCRPLVLGVFNIPELYALIVY